MQNAGLDEAQAGIKIAGRNINILLMGRPMLSKSLIQFSVEGWSCVPFLLFTWGQTMVDVMKIMVTSLKRSQACTATICAPNPAAGHH